MGVGAPANSITANTAIPPAMSRICRDVRNALFVFFTKFLCLNFVSILSGARLGIAELPHIKLTHEVKECVALAQVLRILRLRLVIS